jgi:hypothetical protein
LAVVVADLKLTQNCLVHQVDLVEDLHTRALRVLEQADKDILAELEDYHHQTMAEVEVVELVR